MAGPGLAEARPLVLRPLSLGELLDQTVRIYRQNFLICLGLAALVALPVRLLPLAQQWLAGGAGARPSAAASLGSIAGLLLSGIAIELAALAAMAPLALGQPTSIRAAVGQTARAAWPLLNLLLGAILLMPLLLLWLFVPLLGWITGPGVLYVYLSGVVPLAGVVVIVEGRLGFQALRRGWDLTRRRFWPSATFIIVVYLLTLIGAGIPDSLINAVLRRALAGDATLYSVLQALLNWLTTTLALPLTVIGKTLLYLDLRVRAEGLDLALAAQPEGAPAALASTLRASAPPAETRGLVSSRELRHFSAVTALAVVGVGLLAGLGLILNFIQRK